MMAVFNLVSLALWGFLISYMLRSKPSRLASSCVGRQIIEKLCVTMTLFIWCS
jgi:hypothetical protein